MKYLLFIFLFPLFLIAQEPVVGGVLWDFHTYSADTVKYASDSLKIKFKTAPKLSSYGNYFSTYYTNHGTYDSLATIDSTQIDSLYHRISLPVEDANYSHFTWIKFWLITGTDTLVSKATSMGETKGAMTLYFLFDYDADSTAINVWGYLQGN